MCIRDRHEATERTDDPRQHVRLPRVHVARGGPDPADDRGCLLYTSDAADERSSVDLGGRRIIKKKKTEQAPARH